MKMKVRIASILCIVIPAISGCWGSDCDNNIIKEVASPDGKRVAAVFSRNCGATTENIRVVEIRDAGTAFSAKDPRQFIFTMRGQHKIDVQWLASDHLKIDRPRRPDEIFHEMREWEGVNISYAPE